MQDKTNSEHEMDAWPSDGLESVSECPACGAGERRLIHQGLADRLFFSAPGEWDMYECMVCASAYLDPRPNAETIGLAYRNYFTHQAGDSGAPNGVYRALRQRLANGYLNERFDAHVTPASRLGVWVARMMPDKRAVIEAGMRNLPVAKPGDRLLDLGCGNGMFLKRARDAGWDVAGVDFDAKAVDVARNHGLDVRLGGIEQLDPAVEQFDVITLSHVIEHVHHPLEVLRASLALLKPGGFLWLETPNIASTGHEIFGEYWRGLEPPRHLLLFNPKSLRRILCDAGFNEIETLPYHPMCKGIFGESRQAQDADPRCTSRHRASLGRLVRVAERVARDEPDRREFIALKAWKT